MTPDNDSRWVRFAMIWYYRKCRSCPRILPIYNTFVFVLISADTAKHLSRISPFKSVFLFLKLSALCSLLQWQYSYCFARVVFDFACVIFCLPVCLFPACYLFSYLFGYLPGGCFLGFFLARLACVLVLFLFVFLYLRARCVCVEVCVCVCVCVCVSFKV